MSPPKQARETDSEILCTGQKISYGAGVVSLLLSGNAIKSLANPIFNLTLGLNPALIGLVFMIAQIWDAFTDPTMGSISDNHRGRYGRRKPFILSGSILSGIIFAAIFFIPESVQESETGLFAWFLVGSLLLYTASTVIQVPYEALGYEITDHPKERTSVMAYRSVFAKLVALLLAWVYWLAQLPLFGGTMRGMQVMGIILGAMMILSVLPGTKYTQERFAKVVKKQKRIGLKQSLVEAAKIRPFIYILGLTFITLFVSTFAGSFSLYINIYYVCGGDTVEAAKIAGITGVIGTVTGLIAIPILTLISHRIGKISTMFLCLFLLIIQTGSSWFLFTPSMPYLQLVSAPLSTIGYSGFWIFVSAMKADVCDYDEYLNCTRREGIFSAVATWFQKLSQSIAFGAGPGAILVLIGFDVAKGAEQGDATIFYLRLCYMTIPTLLSILGLFFLYRYALTDERMIEIRSALIERRGIM